MSKTSTMSETGPAENATLLGRGMRNSVCTETLNEAWVLVRYSVPVICQMLLEYSFIVVSVVTIGHLSTVQLAAAALGEITAGVTGLSIIQGFACALDSLLPQAWTSGQPSHVGLWMQRMLVLMAALLMPISAIWLNSMHIFVLLGQDLEVSRYAALYLKCAAFELPGYAFNCVMGRYFQAQGLMHVPSIITMIVAPVNIMLNYLLVWGPEPIRVGFIGAPIAAASSVSLISVLYVICLVSLTNHAAWHPISIESFKRLPELFGMGMAGVGLLAGEWWSWELVGLMASRIGPTPLAAQSILVSSASTAYRVSSGLGVATAVRVGNLLGAGKPQAAHIASRVAIGLAIAQSLILGAIFLGLCRRLPYLFNDDPEVAEIVLHVVPLLAVYQLACGIATVTAGILRACGMITTGAVANFIGYYIIGLPFGAYLAFGHHLGVGGLWIGLAVALFFIAIVLCGILLRLDLDTRVERTKHRVGSREVEREEIERV